ncbi:MAG: DNA primase [Pseudomonadota bacterium]
MSLPQGFLDELRARTGLAALIGRRVRLQRKGREHQGLCPFHNEKTPSFTVNEEKGFYHCFGCGAHGDAISFVMQIEGLTFPEAVERLADEAGLEVPQPSPEARAQIARQASLLDILEMATVLFQNALHSPEGQAARDYLQARGVNAESSRAFRLGYAPAGRGFLLPALKRQGVTTDQAVEAGLVKRDPDSGDLKEYFFSRLLFPIMDRRGRPVAFGGRRLDDGLPKYLNSPDSSLFHKGSLLYNLPGARLALKAGAERLLVVEGYMDVIALAQYGLGAAVAPLGTAMTEAQVAESWRLSDTPVICLDGDAAGRRAASRLVERALPILTPGKSLDFAFLPDGQDPDSLLRSQGKAALQAQLQAGQPLASQVWANLVGGGLPRRPEAWAALKRDIYTEVGRIADAGVQDSYKADLLDRFFKARRPEAAGGRQAQGWRPGTAWRGRSPGPPPAPDRAKPDPSDQRFRPERELLACLVNHPAQAVARIEEIALIDCQSTELERLKATVIDLLAADPELDRDSLQRQLSNLGYGDLLSHLLSAAVTRLCPASAVSAEADVVERQVEVLLAGFDEKRAEAAVREAEARFAAEASDSALADLEAARQARDRAGERLAHLVA